MNLTSLQQHSQKNSASLQEHSDVGQKKEKSDVLDQTEMVEEYTTSKISKKCLTSKKSSLKESESVMQESVQVIKKKTSKDKSSSSNNFAQEPVLSKTLVLDSIGKDTDLTPFWSKSTMEMSKKLWSPTETEFVDLDLKSLNGSSKNLMLNSWFSARMMTKRTSLENCQRTYLQSLQCLLPEITALEQCVIEEKENLKQNKKNQKLVLMNQKYNQKILEETGEEKSIRKSLEEEKERKIDIKLKNKEKKIIKQKSDCLKKEIEYIDDTLKENAGKAKRTRVYFNEEQRKKLSRWFGARRWIYNKCLDAIINKKIKASLSELRKCIINNINFKTENSWMLEYHYDLRDESLRDLLKNIKSNLAKDKNFKMKFMSKKASKITGDSISVLGKHWNKKNNFYSDIFNPIKIKSSEPLPEKLLYSSRLLLTPTKKFYFCIPEPIRKSENQAPENSMIFLDPGVKSFVVGYDPEGKIIIWGERDISRIARLFALQKQITRKNKKRKKQ